MTLWTLHVDKVSYEIDVDHALRQALIDSDGNHTGDKITITDLEGEILAEHGRSAPCIGYGRPRGTRPKTPGASPQS
ncbi:hypothetical protein [Pseudonocardia parietis]|uniref:Lsr2 protein n=1 Tax=Pseudonocardia parietis TaxID=570936 RepID=A0ABS4VY95_9PSEU|nr:hypothetical protein [Pseudonocardia parietis]MBP2368693.1 hypothetical protein [Pseudonocardia parietis]